MQSIEVIPVIPLTQQRVRLYVWSPAHGETKILFPCRIREASKASDALYITDWCHGFSYRHDYRSDASYLFLSIWASWGLGDKHLENTVSKTVTQVQGCFLRVTFLDPLLKIKPSCISTYHVAQYNTLWTMQGREATLKQNKGIVIWNSEMLLALF